MKNFFQLVFAVFCLVTSTNPLLAQWVQTNGPCGGYVYALAVSGTNLFAGTSEGGVLLSTNNGSSWTKVDSGLIETYIFSLAVFGTNIFAGTSVRSVCWITCFYFKQLKNNFRI